MKPPPAWKRKYVSSDQAPSAKHFVPRCLKVGRKQDYQRLNWTMCRVCIEPAAQATAVCIGIVVAPILVRPAESFREEALGLRKTKNVFGRELDKIDVIVFSIFH